MNDFERVVVRFLDGKMQKGVVRNFSVEAEELLLEDAVNRSVTRVPLREVKAVFFVRTLDGDPDHRELKKFGVRKNADALGKKIYLRFKDGESMYGFFRGDIPWKQGYFVTEQHTSAQGFFVTPTDEGSNNIRIFVVGSSLKDVSVITP